MKIEDSNFSNCIEFSCAVLQMRTRIMAACKNKGLEIPTDEQISDYICGYGVNFNDFMADYEQGEGMFIDLAFKRFKTKVYTTIDWINKPTDEELVVFFKEHGNDFDKFLETRVNSGMTDAERVTYNGTIKMLSEEKLVKLWNTFIDESTTIGKDSYIYDSKNEEEMTRKFYDRGKEKIKSVLGSEKRFFNWFNDEEMPQVVENVKNLVLCYWGDIFERIMMFPSAYEFDVEIWGEGDGSTYFSDVFFPNLATLLGYQVNGGDCKIEYVGKK